jgi:peptidoglycan/LPS O-acetylase OafA/YrhL
VSFAAPRGSAEGIRGGFGYRPELDGLRGIAIALVVFTHLYLPGTDAFGWIGVEIFFVLSGFLITSILVAEHDATGGIDLREFYVRRIRRLAPALLVLIAIVTAFQIGVAHEEGLKKAGWVLAYMANWQLAGGGYLAGLAHTWSLAIEEQFYLLWPVALVVALRVGGRRAAFGLAVATAAASLAWRVGLFLWTGDQHRAYFGTDTRLDALMVGCALALLAPLAPRWAPQGRTLAAAIAVIGAMCVVPVWDHTAFMLSVGLGAVIVATGTLLFAQGGPLTFGPLVGLGKLSYSLYLWHYPVMYGAKQLFGGSVPLWTIPLALALAWLSYRFVERPFRVRAAAVTSTAGTRARTAAAPGAARARAR